MYPVQGLVQHLLRDLDGIVRVLVKLRPARHVLNELEVPVRACHRQALELPALVHRLVLGVHLPGDQLAAFVAELVLDPVPQLDVSCQVLVSDFYRTHWTSLPGVSGGSIPLPPSPELPPEVFTLPFGDSSRSSFRFLLISSTALTTRPPLLPPQAAREPIGV